MQAGSSRRRRFFSTIFSLGWTPTQLTPGVQSLPFVIRPIATPEEYEAVLGARSAGYRLGRAQDSADLFDFAPNALVIGVFDKESNGLIGSMRFVSGAHGENELTRYVNLPSPWSEGVKTDIRRLQVERSKYSMQVKVLLLKSCYLLSMGVGADYITVAAPEALATSYRMLGFVDVQEGGLQIQPPGANRPVSVLAVLLHGVPERWILDRDLERFYRVWFEQEHPDLLLPVGDFVNPLVGLEARYLIAHEAGAPSVRQGPDLTPEPGGA